jgi:predicted lipid-binding transport protein (Tim44 family)
MLPKDTSGWLKTAATVAAMAFGAGGIGSLLGSSAFNLGTVSKVAMVPFNFVMSALGGALGPIITGGAIIGAALMFLSPTCRQFAADCFKGLYNSITGYKPEQEHQHQHQPQQEHAPASALKPENAARPLEAAINRAQLEGIVPSSISGGREATVIARAETPERVLPTRDGRAVTDMRLGA